MKTETTTGFEHYSKVLQYLPEYRQKYLLKETDENNSMVYNGVEVHVNAYTIDYHVQHIKDLLAGMGYSVGTNDEKIIIQ